MGRLISQTPGCDLSLEDGFFRPQGGKPNDEDNHVWLFEEEAFLLGGIKQMVLEG